MNKNKKLRKGMTLVEVIVAMTIMFLIFDAVVMALGVAVRQSARTRARDVRTGGQAAQVAKNEPSAMTPAAGGNSYTAKFTEVGAGSSLIQNKGSLDLYNSNFAPAYNNTVDNFKFGYQLKTFGATVSTTNDSANNQYMIKLNNPRDEIVVVTAEKTNDQAYFYTGSSTQPRIHYSPTYTRIIQPHSSITYGWCNAAGPSGFVMNFECTQAGITYGPFNSFTASADGLININIPE